MIEDQNMTPEMAESLGFVELTGQGEGLADGFLDARKQAKALIGFDSSLRFFVGRQIPELQQSDYEIPVRVQKGSWQALLPQTIGQWLLTAVGAGITAYLTAAATKMAQNDFKEIGVRDLFRKSLEGIQWFIKIGKHLGHLTKKKFEGVRWRNNNTEIGIPNDQGEYLYVPKDFLDWYVQAPRSLLSDLVEAVSADLQLNLSVVYPDHLETVSVSQTERSIFYMKEEDEDILFPDLKHGQQVELEGFVTRGNENANSIGFLHRDHILTCYPRSGNIVRFKSALFLKCAIAGVITRLDKFGGTTDPRPKIIFDSLKPLEPDTGQDLFSNHLQDNSVDKDEE